MPLPVLEDMRIASPCTVSWESMTGDDRTRFCGACKLTVYDLSGMTRAEAEALVLGRAAEGNRTCVRLWKRADGTVITQDCPAQTMERVRRRVARLGVALAGLLFMAVGVRVSAQTAQAAPTEGTAAKVKRWIAGSWGSPTPTPYPMMGEIALPATPVPATTPVRQAKSTGKTAKKLPKPAPVASP